MPRLGDFRLVTAPLHGGRSAVLGTGDAAPVVEFAGISAGGDRTARQMNSEKS
jgi:hypothetical protein